MKTILEINKNGNIVCLYTDQIDLFVLGKVTDVKQASYIEFDEKLQQWKVISIEGKVIYTNQNRQKAIEYEIEVFSPGGQYYEESTS